jgi:hypothetical protein
LQIIGTQKNIKSIMGIHWGGEEGEKVSEAGAGLRYQTMET